MSFILDALKKVERDKRRTAAGERVEAMAVSAERFGGRRPWLSMAGVAMMSAVVTAAAVSLFDSGGESPREDASTTLAAMEVEAPVPKGTMSEGASGSAAPPPEPSPLPDLDSARDAEREPVGETRSEAERVEPESMAPAVVGPDDAEPRAEAPADEGEAVEPSEESRSSEPSSAKRVQPFHLVGRERALGDASSVPRSSTGGAGESSGPPPAGLPELVLQGTSVIDGNPVAVISGQRVFEGDRIEGARVVRIGEREVELELDGQRFTLRL